LVAGSILSRVRRHTTALRGWSADVSASDLTFSHGISTGCSVAGTTLSVSDVSGTCSITATMAGNNNYNPVTSAALVVGLSKANQAALVAIATPNPVTFGTAAALSTTGGTTAGTLTFSAGLSTGCT